MKKQWVTKKKILGIRIKMWMEKKRVVNSVSEWIKRVERVVVVV